MKIKQYILTNSCFYYERIGRKRVPHWIEVVDLKTGNVKKLKSGSIIRIVREKK
jgi:transketolase C-terminal domain/subunit